MLMFVCWYWWWHEERGMGGGSEGVGVGVARDLRLSWLGNHVFLLCQTRESSSKTISLGAISTDTSNQLTHYSTFFFY